MLLREAPELAPEEEISSERHPLRDRRVLRLLLASSLLIGGQVAATGFTVLFLHDRFAVSTAIAAGVLAFGQALGGVGRIGFGHWSDRIGTRGRPLRFIALALALALAATAVLVDTTAGLAATALLFAVAFGTSWKGLSFTAATELSGHARAGAAVGVQQSALNASGSVVPIAFAALVAATSWDAAFACAALCAAAAAIVLRRLQI